MPGVQFAEGFFTGIVVIESFEYQFSGMFLIQMVRDVDVLVQFGVVVNDTAVQIVSPFRKMTRRLSTCLTLIQYSFFMI